MGADAMDDEKLIARAKAHSEALEEVARDFVSINGEDPDDIVSGIPKWQRKAASIEVYLDAYIPALAERGFKIFAADAPPQRKE